MLKSYKGSSSWNISTHGGLLYQILADESAKTKDLILVFYFIFVSKDKFILCFFY